MKPALLACLLCLALGYARSSAATELPARNHVPPETRWLQPIGRLPPQSQMRLAIGLPLRSPQVLSNFLRDIYNPSSPNFRRFLTGCQFADQFGPTESDYQRVMAFACSNGLEVAGLHSSRLLVDVSGSAEAVERAFSLRLMKYHHPTEARDFYAPDREPTVPEGVPALDITGLSDISPPRCLNHAESIGAFDPRGGGSGTNGSYNAGDLRAAYLQGVNDTGAGQSVGLLEFDGYHQNDITNYESQQHLPQVPLTPIYLDGYDGAPLTTNGNGEVSLDIEMIAAIAPGISNLVIYEAGEGAAPNDILSRMAEDDTCQSLSCSWGWGGGPTATTDQIFQMMAAQGQSFFCASGDSDAYAAGEIDNVNKLNTPSDNPYITIVGGTSLSTSGPGGDWFSETVWNSGGGRGSSGGYSSHYLIPPWQAIASMAGSGASSKYRNIPDVSGVASNILVDYNNGAQGRFSGTSCAAPLWAAFAALANERAHATGLPQLGFVNPALYLIGLGDNYASAFHDIVEGDNTSPSSPEQFFAEPGYDLCTGWGSPVGLGMINALAQPADPLSLSSASGFDSAGLVSGPFTITSQTLTLSNSSTLSQTWMAQSLSPWLEVIPTEGTLPPLNQTQLTVQLTTNSARLPAGSYATFVLLTNLTTGNVLTRRYTLTVLTQLVQNGGFETGAFDDWTLSGNTNDTRALLNDTYAHSGLYGAQLGASGAMGYLSQTLATIPGQFYRVSLWFDVPSAGAPNEFSVTWDGSILFDQANLPQTSWTNLRFLVSSRDIDSVLQIGFRDDPAFIGLDDVNVSAVSLPMLLSPAQVTNGVTFNCVVMTGQMYQAQFASSLKSVPWQNLGSAFTASNAIVTIIDTNTTGAARFYRLVVLP